MKLFFIIQSHRQGTERYITVQCLLQDCQLVNATDLQLCQILVLWKEQKNIGEQIKDIKKEEENEGGEMIGPDAPKTSLEGDFLAKCCMYFGEEKVGGEMQ